jgi:hypothetical protein
MGKPIGNSFLEFTSAPICPHTILLPYERAQYRKLQEDKGTFKHEPTSNVDYNQDMDMEMEMEGVDENEVKTIQMMVLLGSNIPGDIWNLSRGYEYGWSEPTYPRNPNWWKTSQIFLAEALKNSVIDVAKVDVPVRKVDEEVVHCNIRDATASQSAVIYKVFGKIREWMEWEASDQKKECVPLRLTVCGAVGTGKSFIINTTVSLLNSLIPRCARSQTHRQANAP